MFARVLLDLFFALLWRLSPHQSKLWTALASLWLCIDVFCPFVCIPPSVDHFPVGKHEIRSFPALDSPTSPPEGLRSNVLAGFCSPPYVLGSPAAARSVFSLFGRLQISLFGFFCMVMLPFFFLLVSPPLLAFFDDFVCLSVEFFPLSFLSFFFSIRRCDGLVF